jgi:RHS repeat-associated protein
VNGFKYVYQYKDHLGNVRLSYSDADLNGAIDPSTEIIEEKNYYPFGMVQKGYNNIVNGTAHPYGFGGKEENKELGLEWLDFHARNYDASLGRWMNVDPLADQRSWVSPYNYVQNNPISRIDPTGALDNPIYGTDGEFLGTDDRGLQGDAIVMNKKAFKQGMSHNEAKAFDNGTTSMSDGAKSKMNNHFNGLSSRPDYDGFVTIKEGVAWAKSHPGVKDNPSASDALYINSAKLNFGSLSVDNIGLEEGEKGNVNLFNFVNFFSNSSRYSTYALGNTQIQLLNAKTGAVKLFSDAFDWDFHEPWTPVGGYPTTVRDNLIRIDRANKGLNNSHGFPIYMYGVGTIKTSTK